MDNSPNNQDEINYEFQMSEEPEQKEGYKLLYPEPEVEEDDLIPGCPAWMLTFGDTVSLLLTFFVLILSFSNISTQAKSNFITFKTGLDPGIFVGGTPEQGVIEVTEEMGAKSGEGETVDEELVKEQIETEALLLADKTEDKLNVSFNQIKKYFKEKEVEEQTADLEKSGGKGSYIVLLEQSFVFSVGRDSFKPGSQVYLDKIGKLISELPNDIVITGYANDFNKIAYPIYPSNNHLAIARANTIAQYLISVWNIDPERIGIQIEEVEEEIEAPKIVKNAIKTYIKIRVLSEFTGHIRNEMKIYGQKRNR